MIAIPNKNFTADIYFPFKGLSSCSHLLFLVSLQYELRREIHIGYKCVSA